MKDDDTWARRPDYPDGAAGKAAAVDDYFSSLLAGDHPGLSRTLQRNAEAGLPEHDVSPTQGKFLQLLVQISGARRVLEIGTLGGYSSIWMAGGLPEGGVLDTIEVEPETAGLAQENIAACGHAGRVNVHVRRALDILPTLTGPYDFFFIDADKPNNPAYLEWALKLSRPGSIIIADNVVRGGAVIDASSRDDRVQGVRQFLADVSASANLSATALQTTGEKGWDGFCLIRVGG